MLDFKELAVDGQSFEQLIREIIFAYGLHVTWSGRGPDGGRDLICHEEAETLFAKKSNTWLIQCKHFAHADRSVGIADLDDIIDSCGQHHATGYLLACSTQPSSAVVQRLEGVSRNPANAIVTTFWDGITIERLLSTPKHWAIAQRFFPQSAGAWRIYATERPNDFVAHYRGYVFHLSNRIGSRTDHHLPSIENRIKDIEAVKLPKGHFIRPRAVWHDDKNGGYTWYVDYMYPTTKSPAISKAKLGNLLHDDWALEDGQMYNWDIKFIEYSAYSDHYDQDHYDYYTKYMPNFLEGKARNEKDWTERYALKQEVEDLQNQNEKKRDIAFDALITTLKSLPFVRLMRGQNVGIEDVHKFERRYVWTDVIGTIKSDPRWLFSALLIFEVQDEKKFHDMLSHWPIEVVHSFRVGRVHVYLPESGLAEDKFPIYDVQINIHPTLMTDPTSTRVEFDKYFDLIRSSIEKFIQFSK